MKEKAQKKTEAIGHFLHHMTQSITTKIILIIFIVAFPLNILAIQLSNAAMDAMIEQAELSVRNVMENYNTELQKRMDYAGYFVWYMVNEDINGMIVAKQQEDDEFVRSKATFYHAVRNGVQMSGGADGYFYYLCDVDEIFVWDEVNTDKTAGEKFVRKEIEEGIRMGWNLMSIEGRSVLCFFTQVRNMIYGNWIYLDNVINELMDDIQYKNVVFSFDDEAVKEEKADIIVSAALKKTDVYLNGVLDRNEIVADISSYYKYMRMGAFMGLLLIPILILSIFELLLRPLQTINQAEKRMQEGDWDYRITKKANSIEYEDSYRSFNQMAEHIKTLKIENYEKEVDRQKTELRNLQLQIHPHFLINSFNLIYTLAQKDDRKAIQKVIIYLSNYFRYIFAGTKSLELYAKEQDLIEQYIEIARLRYPGCIEMEYNYDPEIPMVRIPPLLIHNFVENVIKHVVNLGHVTNISLVGQYDDGIVTFMVMDDGQGMTEQRLEEVNRRMFTGNIEGEHIGFANSLKRMKYFYGEQADILINSELGLGTCVTISFPYNLEVKDETFDGK